MSLDIFAHYATDESLENDGAWFDLGGDAKVKVARSGNPRYAKKLTALYEKNKKVLDLGGDAADKLSNDMMVEVLAETILLDWKGLSFKKQELPYSVENSKMLLSVKDFRRVIAGFSEDVEAYRVKEEQAQGEA